MVNKPYNKNTLEAVTQGGFSGEPARSLDPLQLAKTTLFVTILLVNNTFADDFINEIHSGIDKFNENKIVIIEYSRAKPETAEEAEARSNREQDEARDVALNKAEVRDGRYWVDGKWVSTKYTKPNTAEDLKDSDNDGYDDYTEFKNGTNPKDPKIFPAIRDGRNKVTIR
jgi:hypothetical protein